MLKKIKTACRGCVFAQYKDITQIGCQLNKIYKYARRDVEIVPAYDENSEFFIINGAICNTYRNQAWSDRNKDNDLIELVKKENKLNYSLFLSYDENKSHDFSTIINDILQLDIPPKSLYILNRSDENHSGFMIRNYKRNWREINIVDKDRLDFDYLHQMIISRKIKTFFYLNLPFWYENINSLVNNINNRINDHLQEILSITHNNMVVGALTNMNIVFGRNFLQTIEPKKIIKLEDLQ